MSGKDTTAAATLLRVVRNLATAPAWRWLQQLEVIRLRRCFFIVLGLLVAPLFGQTKPAPPSPAANPFAKNIGSLQINAPCVPNCDASLAVFRVEVALPSGIAKVLVDQGKQLRI